MPKKSIWLTMDKSASWPAQRATSELAQMWYLISFKTFNQFRTCDNLRTCLKHLNAEPFKAIKMMNQWPSSRHIEAVQNQWHQTKSQTMIEIGSSVPCPKKINYMTVGFCNLMIPRTRPRRKTCSCKISTRWRPILPMPRKAGSIKIKRALRTPDQSLTIGFLRMVLRIPTEANINRELQPIWIQHLVIKRLTKIRMQPWTTHKTFQRFKTSKTRPTST